jgi:hypothetical protein
MVRNRVASTPTSRRQTWRSLGVTAVLAAVSATALLVFIERHYPGTPTLDGAPRAEAATPSPDAHPTQTAELRTATVLYDRAIVDPAPSMQPDRLDFTHNRPLDPVLQPWPVIREARLAPPLPPVRQQEPDAPLDSPAVTTAQTLPSVVPLPVPRPPEFRNLKPDAPAPAKAPAPRVVASAEPQAAPSDSPSLIEKLFGARKPSAPDSALGYAPRDVLASTAPDMRIKPETTQDGATAIYDISAKVVYMPNGEKLEAHSGLGDMLDDPRYVHVRMKGPTPVGTYTLSERERLFHGVRAIRMTPVGGSAAIHGRDGILAHTYMLGPNGDSNGCVSFKNYDKFLQAYLKGEVKRLVVVAGGGRNSLPRMVDSRYSADQRS